MKKLAIGASILVATVILATFAIGPGLIDRRLNRTRHHATWVREDAEKLHRSLTIADLHADTLLFDRDLLEEHGHGHVDVPRLLQGNVALQAFTVVTKAPRELNMVRNADSSDLVLPLVLVERWPRSTWTSLKARALFQAAKFKAAVGASRNQLVWIKTSADLNAYLERRKREPLIVGGFLGLEGAQAVEGDVANLSALYEAGFRMMSPTHFTDNRYGGSATGIEKGGLTQEGRSLLAAMESRKMIVDLAHAAPQTIDDVLALATRPVLVSHTGVKATCDSNRNLTDDQLRRIAQTGGIIGIAYFDAAVCGTDAAAIARAIRHASNVIGVDHVALGSDFDGGVAAPFDASDLVLITEALMAAGFSESEIAKIMGGNTVRFLAANLPVE
jgi:membrane dipeptidase